MDTKLNRHYFAQLFMILISVAGWLIALSLTASLPVIEKPFELLFLLGFIFVCEYYPMPFRKGNSSLTFPVVYLVSLVYGIELAALLYFMGVLLTTVIHRRPIRIIFFNPAQLILSLYSAYLISEWIMQQLYFSATGPITVSFLLFISLFYILNNLIVDAVLTIRPEKYTFAMWSEKGRGEVFSFSISLVYGFLLHYLGSQNRGEVDGFTYFFFLSPLLFLALISSVIMRLRTDKQRLKALFRFSSELNKVIPVKLWEREIQKLISEVVPYEECFLFTKDDKNEWKLAISEGELRLCPQWLNEAEDLDQLTATTVFNKQDMIKAPFSRYFKDNIQAAVYAPLLLDYKMTGCLIMTKTRTNSFVLEDVHSISTIANQLAIFLKTQQLFSEQEQRLLLEERNRIAHDIHDGIAQTLAGAVMKLDTAAKKMIASPKDAQRLILASNQTLREGLKEVRNSIYALRPYPTEQLGLHAAIRKKISTLADDENINIDASFEIRGMQTRLSLLTEKVIFSIVQESIHNCIKHAKATKLDVVLSYQKDQIYLKIKDDGMGFSLYEAMTAAMKEAHYGILQMNENAAKVGASLQIDSREKAGTEIRVKIPTMGFEGNETIDQNNIGG